VSAHPEPPASGLLTYLRMLAGDPQSSQFFDLRYAPPGGVMHQRFVSVLRVQQLARRIAALAGRNDVYVGVALRDRAHGDKSAISGSHMLYIECDEPGARERVENFAYSPSMIVASGFIRSSALQVHAALGCGCWRHVANGWGVCGR
jgi:hypothetical protein